MLFGCLIYQCQLQDLADLAIRPNVPYIQLQVQKESIK